MGHTSEILEPLYGGERLLLAGLDQRPRWETQVPEAMSDAKCLRADFVRALALNCGRTLLHIEGYWIDGALDFENSVSSVRLEFWGCKISGEVNLNWASIAGISFAFCDLFRIYGSYIKCAGNFSLSHSRIDSGVILLSATIAGELECLGADIRGKDWVLTLDAAQVGEFKFQRVLRADAVSLLGTQVRTLYDDYASWKTHKESRGMHRFNGFRYGALGTESHFGPAPTDAEGRIAWLQSQFHQPGEAAFEPQPWDWLARVLGEMGHLEESRRVAIAKQEERLRVGVIRGVAAAFHRLYGLVYGYGYRPLRLAGWSAAVWLACGAIYALAADAGLVRPTDRAVLEDTRFTCPMSAYGSPVWARCDALLRSYRPFNPFMYSLDLIVPISGLQQSKAWEPVTVLPCAAQPVFGLCAAIPTAQPTAVTVLEPMAYSPLGVATAAAALAERLFGWLAGLMFVSVATGLIRRT